LRRGSEAAFRSLVERHQATLLRVARTWVKDAYAAEEVVQQTWVQVLEGIDGFEARSSVKTWLCGICINVARARSRKERRSVPMSSVGSDVEGSAGPAVDPSRFFGPETHWAGHWFVFPNGWPPTPEDMARTTELKTRVLAALDHLPEAQREVLMLRDVEGLDADEVCNILALTDSNQRVLLHRARSKLRTMLEEFFDASRAP
jgi:RNA polymerase sigma-70 factor (ECF subfamily)